MLLERADWGRWKPMLRTMPIAATVRTRTGTLRLVHAAPTARHWDTMLAQLAAGDTDTIWLAISSTARARNDARRAEYEGVPADERIGRTSPPSTPSTEMGTSDRNRVQPPTRPLARANRDAGTLQHEPCSSSGDKGAFRLSQEMITIVTVGVALAALNLVTTANTANLIQERRAARAAWQAQSTAWQAENHRRREQWELEIQRLRGETRSHLDAFHREISRPRAERP